MTYHIPHAIPGPYDLQEDIHDILKDFTQGNFEIADAVRRIQEVCEGYREYTCNNCSAPAELIIICPDCVEEEHRCLHCTDDKAEYCSAVCAQAEDRAAPARREDP